MADVAELLGKSGIQRGAFIAPLNTSAVVAIRGITLNRAFSVGRAARFILNLDNLISFATSAISQLIVT
jgi:hypothetical protein